MTFASGAQLEFAAELVVFVAAASAVALVTLRGSLFNESGVGRAAMVVGCAALSAAAFLHGGTQVGDPKAAIIVVLRLGGAGLVLISCVRGWAGGRLTRILLILAMALVLTGTAAGATGALGWASLGAGGGLLGAVVVGASRKTIAARVVASAAATLLIVVLVLGVALSVVLVDTVQEAAMDRLQRRAANEAAEALRQASLRIREAKTVAADLPAERFEAAASALAGAGTSAPALSQDMEELSTQYLDGAPLVYVNVHGVVQGTYGVDAAEAFVLAAAPPVTEALAKGDPRGSVEVGTARAMAIGVHPVILQDFRVVGAVAAGLPLDATYLAQISSDDPHLSLALFSFAGSVARHGPQPARPAVASMVEAALVDGRSDTGVVGERFVAVVPVKAGDGRPRLALVASSPTTLVSATRDELARSLFLVALAGTLLALCFAAVVGARIGGGLGRLRRAAEAIHHGDFGVRSGIDSDDEVGTVGRAFDAMAASVRDKTDAEERLRGRLEAVVAGMGEALVGLDGAGRITDFNRKAEELLGVTQAQALGLPVDDVVRLHGPDASQGLVSLCSAVGGWSAVGAIETPDGGRVPVAVSIGFLRGRGAEAGSRVVVLADLTREREVEQMKTEFLARVGHELRHPLVPVIGYAEILTRKQVAPEHARSMLEVMLVEARKLLRIVELLEFFAASGARRVLVRRQETDPRALVEGVVQRWQSQAHSPVEIRGRVRRGTPMVLADGSRLGRCLDELVDNAVKFSPDGGQIIVSAAPADGGVRFGVSDSGIGMTDAQQATAFEEFVQGDPGETRSFGGLGLGLAFVRRVAEAHGGTLRCDSSLGTGARFSITIPAPDPKTTVGQSTEPLHS